ncbi:hypothetical protein BpHYR1_049597 [Brachionus plicatilis]|uniref:Uncharacterized protein n=1 Tax=Brachionus plicatilis TaxID=10195 RepID=A0A3M7QBM0_BRAPC|nr:hypothetical protein BpHYR1_049597 [Brachionus plicatilis]
MSHFSQGLVHGRFLGLVYDGLLVLDFDEVGQVSFFELERDGSAADLFGLGNEHKLSLQLVNPTLYIPTQSAFSTLTSSFRSRMNHYNLKECMQDLLRARGGGRHIK